MDLDFLGIDLQSIPKVNIEFDVDDKDGGILNLARYDTLRYDLESDFGICMMTNRALRIGFVGAGCVNFGSNKGPWDHASRLEKFENVEVVAIADIIPNKAQEVLVKRLSGDGGHMYKNCQVFESHEDMLKKSTLDAVIIGTTPLHRGSLENGRDIELVFLKAGVHAFIEKPLSVELPECTRDYMTEVIEASKQNKLITSVGYMFRYHAAVQKMKDLIQTHGGKVMAFNARYYHAYTQANRPLWWNINKSGGPIVEQATHFCDLARYIVGEVCLESIQTTCLKADDPSGAAELSDMTEGVEAGLTSTDRVPRVTTSQWRFQNGAIGSLMHVVALQGTRYESHIDVLMDGLRMTLYEPYHPECKLLVRDSQSDSEQCYAFGDADSFEEELRVFLDSVRNGTDSNILSTYEDAVKTYELSWKIRQAGE